jgi:hypothetical protein
MTSDQDEASDYDQDSEPTMTAPLEGRPDGIEDESVADSQSDTSSPDADDQTGHESPGGS